MRMIRRWLDVPQLLARIHRQNQTIVSQNINLINAIRNQRETIMTLGTKTLAALSQLDNVIAAEAEELKAAIAEAVEGSNVDGEVAAALLERVDRIKAIVPDVVGNDENPPVDDVVDAEIVGEPTDETVTDENAGAVETPDGETVVGELPPLDASDHADAPDEATSGDPA